MSKMEYRDYLFLKKLDVTGSVSYREWFFGFFSEKDLEYFMFM